MLIMKCTKKVQAHLGIAKDELSDVSSQESVLGGWYVNLFTLDRRKTFIFMNERTYLSFLLFGVRKSNSKKTLFPEMCLGGIVQLLRLQEVPLPLIGNVIEDSFESRYANTDSKRVLGNLNDLASLYWHKIMSRGGLAYCDLNEIILQVNHTPQRNLGWKNSAEVTSEILDAKRA